MQVGFGKRKCSFAIQANKGKETGKQLANLLLENFTLTHLNIEVCSPFALLIQYTTNPLQNCQFLGMDILDIADSLASNTGLAYLNLSVRCLFLFGLSNCADSRR